MKLAWATDIHLDHARGGTDLFIAKANRSDVDGLVITGDISNYSLLDVHLDLLGERIDVPVYFVLGNHDAYGGSIGGSREIAHNRAAKDNSLRWLDGKNYQPLSGRSGIVGVGGWADATSGDFFKNPFMLNDYELIDELKRLPAKILQETLVRFGREAANRLKRSLKTVPESCKHLVVATHVPPWREADVYQGSVADDMYAPHFTCIAVGLVLNEYALNHLDRSITVLCGHTHGGGKCNIYPHMVCKTGKSEYGYPRIVEVLYLP